MEYCNLYLSAILHSSSTSPTSVQIRENTDQKKLRIWTLFTQTRLLKLVTIIFTSYLGNILEYFKVLKDFKIFGVSWFSFSTIEPLRKTENDGKLK